MITKLTTGGPRNHVCRESLDIPPSQGCDRIEAKIDLVRDQLFGAKAILDLCIRGASSPTNGDILSALALVSSSLAKAADHVSQIEMAACGLGKAQDTRELPSVN